MKTNFDRFLYLRDWLLANYKTILLSILLPVISFPVFQLTYAAAFGIDDPLPWVYNYFANGNYTLEKDIIFPHGPLAFLLYPIPIGNNVFAASSVYLLAGFSLCMSLFKINESLYKQSLTHVTLALLVILSFCELQLLLVAITLSQVVLFHLYNKKTNLLLAMFFCVFAVHLKTYSGALCCLLVAGEFGYSVLFKKRIKTGFWIIGLFFLFLFIFRLALFQTLNGTFTFLWGQFQLSADNSEAVSYYQENNWWFVGISLISLFIIPFLSKDKLTRYLFIIMLLPLYAAWKHGMARGEEHHLNGFLNVLLLFTLLVWVICQEKKTLIIILFIVSICSFLFNLALNEGYKNHKSFELFKVYNLYHLVSEYDSIAIHKNKISEKNCHFHVLPDSILKIIGKHTVDVYPWNFAYIAANNLNWQPRPVIHSYAAYTSWLDKQNAKHLSSGNSAQFFIWELTDMDGNGVKLDGIDSRYLLNDEPQSILNFFANYQLKIKTPTYLIYEKKSEPFVITKTTSSSIKLKFNEWLEVPASENDLITRSKLKINKSLLGTIKSFLFKGEAYYIYYELENKQVYSFRIVPKNAADGIWINPLVLDPYNNSTESRVKRIKLSSTDLRMATSEFEITFEQTKFTSKELNTNATTSTQNQCFNKNEILNKSNLFFAVTNVEDPVEPTALIKDSDVKKTQDCYLTAPSSYELEPGKSTEHFIFKVDTAKIHATQPRIRFLMQAYLKSTKPVNIIFVVAQNGSVFLSENLKYCTLQDDNLWHYSFSSQILHKSQLNLNEPYEFYLWNSDDREKIYVDNFSVSVDLLPN